jgi:type VI secretion system secreted protein Hcp
MDYFLRLDGIDGEATLRGYEKWLEVSTMHWGVALPTGPMGGGAGVGRAAFQPLALTMAAGRSTPSLMLACAGGAHIATAELAIVRNEGDSIQLTAKAEMTGVMVGLLGLEGSEEERTLGQSLSLTYASITLTTFAQDRTGAMATGATATWNVAKNATV